MSRLEDDLYVAGNVASRTLTIPDSTIVNAAVSASAAIAHTKLQHQHRVMYTQPNTTATAVTQVIHHVYGATGTLVSVKAGSIAIAVGAATVTVDIKKNGTTVLSGVRRGKGDIHLFSKMDSISDDANIDVDARVT